MDYVPGIIVEAPHISTLLHQLSQLGWRANSNARVHPLALDPAADPSQSYLHQLAQYFYPHDPDFQQNTQQILRSLKCIEIAPPALSRLYLLLAAFQEGRLPAEQTTHGLEPSVIAFTPTEVAFFKDFFLPTKALITKAHPISPRTRHVPLQSLASTESPTNSRHSTWEMPIRQLSQLLLRPSTLPSSTSSLASTEVSLSSYDLITSLDPVRRKPFTVKSPTEFVQESNDQGDSKANGNSSNTNDALGSIWSEIAFLPGHSVPVPHPTTLANYVVPSKNICHEPSSSCDSKDDRNTSSNGSVREAVFIPKAKLFDTTLDHLRRSSSNSLHGTETGSLRVKVRHVIDYLSSGSLLSSPSPPVPSSFRFIELFAGIGGFRVGLEPLGTSACSPSPRVCSSSASMTSELTASPSPSGPADVCSASEDPTPRSVLTHDDLVEMDRRSFILSNVQPGEAVFACELRPHARDAYLAACLPRGTTSSLLPSPPSTSTSTPTSTASTSPFLNAMPSSSSASHIPVAFHGNVETLHPSIIPPFDLLTAGFPCQPFSRLGAQPGFNDMTKGTHLSTIVVTLFILVLSLSLPCQYPRSDCYVSCYSLILSFLDSSYLPLSL